MKHQLCLGYAAAIATILLLSCGDKPSVPATARETGRRALYFAQKTSNPPIIDGIPNDPAWQAARWYQIDQPWMGDTIAKEGGSGRFQVLWDENQLYILVETVDDALVQNMDALRGYSQDDGLIIMVDEDHSGGNFQNTHNAFTYFIGLDSSVVDRALDGTFRYYNDHARSARTCLGTVCLWEIVVKLYPDSYQDDGDDNRPVRITTGKKIGFAIAYADNDGGSARDNLLGSVPLTRVVNERTLDASVFGTLECED
ncbi:MAG: sugar-binding protein [Saprospiraceae bacterium]